jgi:hypothetical protein
VNSTLTIATKASFFGQRNSFAHRGDSRNDRRIRTAQRLIDLPVYPVQAPPAQDPDQLTIDRFEAMLASCEDAQTGCSPEDQF